MKLKDNKAIEGIIVKVILWEAKTTHTNIISCEIIDSISLLEFMHQ